MLPLQRNTLQFLRNLFSNFSLRSFTSCHSPIGRTRCTEHLSAKPVVTIDNVKSISIHKIVSSVPFFPSLQLPYLPPTLSETITACLPILPLLPLLLRLVISIFFLSNSYDPSSNSSLPSNTIKTRTKSAKEPSTRPVSSLDSFEIWLNRSFSRLSKSTGKTKCKC